MSKTILLYAYQLHISLFTSFNRFIFKNNSMRKSMRVQNPIQNLYSLTK